MAEEVAGCLGSEPLACAARNCVMGSRRQRAAVSLAAAPVFGVELDSGKVWRRKCREPRGPAISSATAFRHLIPPGALPGTSPSGAHKTVAWHVPEAHYRERLAGWCRSGGFPAGQTTPSISTPKRGVPQTARMPNVAWQVVFGSP